MKLEYLFLLLLLILFIGSNKEKLKKIIRKQLQDHRFLPYKNKKVVSNNLKLKPSLPINFPQRMKSLTTPEPKEYTKCYSLNNCRKLIYI